MMAIANSIFRRMMSFAALTFNSKEFVDGEKDLNAHDAEEGE